MSFKLYLVFATRDAMASLSAADLKPQIATTAMMTMTTTATTTSTTLRLYWGPEVEQKCWTCQGCHCCGEQEPERCLNQYAQDDIDQYQDKEKIF